MKTPLNILKNLAVVVALFSITACTKSKVAQTGLPTGIPVESKPEWVDQRPHNPSYYIGIGSSNKLAQPLDYQGIAKKNALNDLASEISVRVQGSTFLNSLEVNKAFSEEFISTINTTTDEKIEDYEVAGTWEDKHTYFVYYRLNKASYQQKKMAKKNQAMSSANDFLIKGQDAEKVSNIPAAVDLYLRGLFALRDYWNEVNEYPAETGKLFLDNELYSSLQRVASGLTIRPASPKIVLSSENQYSASTSFQIMYNNVPVKGITTSHVYPKSKYMKPRVQATDDSGSVHYIIEDINTKEKELAVSVDIDLMPLQPHDLDKKITGALIKNLKTDSRKIPVEFIAPSFTVSSVEKVYGTATSTTTLASALQSELVKKGLRQTGNAADYRIEIESNSTEGGTSQGFTVALLEMTITVTDRENHIIYKESANNIKGLQLNRDTASIEAYKKGRERIQEQVIPTLLDAIF